MRLFVVVFDAPRADHTSAYGYDWPTMPALERLAGDGVRYRRYYTTATWTKRTSASVLSGTYPPSTAPGPTRTASTATSLGCRQRAGDGAGNC